MKAIKQLEGLAVVCIEADGRLEVGMELQLTLHREGTVFKAVIVSEHPAKGNYVLVDIARNVEFKDNTFKRISPLVIPFIHRPGINLENNGDKLICSIRPSKLGAEIIFPAGLQAFGVTAGKYVSFVQTEFLNYAAVGLQFSDTAPDIPHLRLTNFSPIQNAVGFISHIKKNLGLDSKVNRFDLIFSSRVFNNPYTSALVFTVNPVLQGDTKTPPRPNPRPNSGRFTLE